jgi:hypothetical protein
MSVKLKTPSNGSVTLAPEDTGSDVVLTVPAVAGEVVNDVTLRTELNATGSAPIYAARAWVNFDGTTTVPTIRASGNVSSVTRNGTGDYTVNFATAMPDANYCVDLTSGDIGATNRFQSPSTYATNNVRVFTYNVSNANTDHSFVHVAIFR